MVTINFKIMVIGLTFRTKQVVSQKQNETEYKHTFIHEHKNDAKSQSH